MKLGVAFNVFSGLEFLRPAAKNVRPFADYIVGVYSKQSNQGHPAPSYMMPLLISLVKEKLLDDVVEHLITPSDMPIDMQGIQRSKRQLGQECCRREGCTHLMSRDCDEFYIPKQFVRALEYLNQYQLLICGLCDYVGSPLLRSKALTPLHVSVVQDINCQFAPKDFGVLQDHERTIETSSFKILSRTELLMHHFTAVRYNQDELKRKFQGHSHFMRLGDKAVNDYSQMIGEAQAGGKYDAVEDVFGIQHYWNDGFAQWIE